MEIQNVPSEALKRKFKIRVPSEEVSKRVSHWLQTNTKKVKLDGFRPGKIPAHLLQQRFGSQALQEAAEQLVKESLQKILKDHKFKTLGHPSYDITPLEKDQDFSFTINVDILPEFELQDFSRIPLQKISVTVSDQDVEKDLKTLVKNHQKFEPAPADHPSTLKDQVQFSLEIHQQGQKLKQHSHRKLKTILGEEREEDDFGFLATTLTSRKKGDTFKIEHTFDESFQDEELAGETATLQGQILEVAQPVKSELNDSLAKDFGCETVEDLKQHLRKDLENKYHHFANLYHKRHLLDHLEKIYDFELPESLVNNEFDTILTHLKNEIDSARSKGELTPEEDKPLDSYKDEYQKIAERRVRLGLIVEKIAEDYNLTFTSEEIKRLIQQEASRYPGMEKQFIEFYLSNPEIVRQQLLGPALENKVIECILSKLTTEPTQISYPELKEKLNEILPGFIEEDNEAELQASDEAEKEYLKEETEKSTTEKRKTK